MLLDYVADIDDPNAVPVEKKFSVEHVGYEAEDSHKKFYNHAFIIIGRDQSSKLNRFETWNDDTLIVDPWLYNTIKDKYAKCVYSKKEMLELLDPKSLVATLDGLKGLKHNFIHNDKRVNNKLYIGSGVTTALVSSKREHGQLYRSNKIFSKQSKIPGLKKAKLYLDLLREKLLRYYSPEELPVNEIKAYAIWGKDYKGDNKSEVLLAAIAYAITITDTLTIDKQEYLFALYQKSLNINFIHGVIYSHMLFPEHGKLGFQCVYHLKEHSNQSVANRLTRLLDIILQLTQYEDEIEGLSSSMAMMMYFSICNLIEKSKISPSDDSSILSALVKLLSLDIFSEDNIEAVLKNYNRPLLKNLCHILPNHQQYEFDGSHRLEMVLSIMTDDSLLSKSTSSVYKI